MRRNLSKRTPRSSVRRCGIPAVRDVGRCDGEADGLFARLGQPDLDRQVVVVDVHHLLRKAAGIGPLLLAEIVASDLQVVRAQPVVLEIADGAEHLRTIAILHAVLVAATYVHAGSS